MQLGGVITVAECVYDVPWEIPLIPLSGTGCTLTLPACMLPGDSVTLYVYYEPLSATTAVDYTPLLYWRQGAAVVTAGFSATTDNHTLLWVNDAMVLAIPMHAMAQYVMQVQDAGQVWTVNGVSVTVPSVNSGRTFGVDPGYECLLGTPVGTAAAMGLAAVVYREDWYTGSRLLLLVKDVSVCPLRARRWVPYVTDRWAINATTVQLFLTSWDNLRCRTPPWIGDVLESSVYST